MIPNHLALDIETVPLKPLSEYSNFIQDKINDKISKKQERNSDFDFDYFASIHGDFGKVICISLGYITEKFSMNLKSLAGDDEKSILDEFNHIIENHRGIYIHYNGLNFDVPFILQRMAHHNMKPTNMRFTDLRRFSSNPHFDVMMMYYNWDMQKVLPLGVLAELHKLPSPKEDLAGDQVYETYNKGDWNRIIRYCEFDTATTLNLWWKLSQYKTALPLSSIQFSESSES